MAEKRKYDSTVARIAGNIAAGMIARSGYRPEVLAAEAVEYARFIVAEVERTELPPSTNAVGQRSENPI